MMSFLQFSPCYMPPGPQKEEVGGEGRAGQHGVAQGGAAWGGARHGTGEGRGRQGGL